MKLNHLQSTQPSSKYHTTLFKVPHNPLQSTTPPSSKYHTTLLKIPQHPLRSRTQPSSKYNTPSTKYNLSRHTPIRYHHSNRKSVRYEIRINMCLVKVQLEIVKMFTQFFSENLSKCVDITSVKNTIAQNRQNR